MFLASLVYIVGSEPVKATQWDPVSEFKKQKQMNKQEFLKVLVQMQSNPIENVLSFLRNSQE